METRRYCSRGARAPLAPVALLAAAAALAASCGGGGGPDASSDAGGDESGRCPSGFTLCGGACVDTWSDRDNCGACNVRCAVDQVCDDGVCAVGCAGGLRRCSDGCRDTYADPSNCGGCQVRCPGGENGEPACVFGACDLLCDEGFWDLDGEEGCEYACAFIRATELCNGSDDNCNGKTDEGFECGMNSTVSCLTDCGSTGTGLCGISCRIPTGSLCAPPAESCNGIDDDCDGQIDETFPCKLGTVVPCTASCGSAGAGLCQPGCALPAAAQCSPPAERCNGRDDDCDGSADDGYDCAMGTAQECTTLCGSAGGRTCMADCRWGRCCAGEEVCGNLCDDDCSGQADEGCASAPPVNDTCAGAMSITAGGLVTGDTTLALDHSSGCGGGGGKDVYFYFDVGVASDVFIATYKTSWDTLLYVSRTCGGAEVGCSDDAGGAVQSELHLRSLPPGRYWVAVDGHDPLDAGPFTMDFFMTPDAPAGERCGDPLPLEPTSSGSTCPFSGDAAGTCGGSGKDVVYYFSVPSTRTVRISACSPSSTFDTVLHLRSSCTSIASETACSDDLASCTVNPRLSEISATLTRGVYYLFVDGWGSGCGPYLLQSTGI